MSGDSKVDFANLATIKEFCKTLVKGGKLQLKMIYMVRMAS